MRTTKTISVSLPPKQLKEMERGARRENRTLSELVRDTFRRYQAGGPLPATLAEALGWVREDAKRKKVRLTQREINSKSRPCAGNRLGEKENSPSDESSWTPISSSPQPLRSSIGTVTSRTKVI